MKAREAEGFQRYLRQQDDDSALLLALAERLDDALAPLLDDFYDRALADPGAAGVLRDAAKVAALRHQLRGWVRRVLVGPHGPAAAEQSARIGRRHVEVGLPQRYMPLAMNVMREHLRRLAFRVHEGGGEPLARALAALDRALDLELSIMLETYAEDSTERLRQNERLATIGQLAASLGHELRNPIGVIQTSLLLLRTKYGDADPSLRQTLDRIARATRLAGDLCRQLLEFARVKQPRRQTFSMQALVRDALAQVEVPPEIQVHVEIDPTAAEASADAADLSHLVANLVRNSVQAITSKRRAGTIHVRARRPESTLELEVEDDGPGMTPEVAARVFEPLFTTRPNGTGLGLAICRDVATAHGGTLEVDSAPHHGARFVARIPQ